MASANVALIQALLAADRKRAVADVGLAPDAGSLWTGSTVALWWATLTQTLEYPLRDGAAAASGAESR